jgi:hypothetical protein
MEGVVVKGTRIATADAKRAVDAMVSERGVLEARARECQRGRDYWQGWQEVADVNNATEAERERYAVRARGCDVEREYWQRLADEVDAARERIRAAALEADDYELHWSNEE